MSAKSCAWATSSGRSIHQLGKVAVAERSLKFIATCPICLPQLFNSVGLIHILGQLAHPEVVD